MPQPSELSDDEKALIAAARAAADNAYAPYSNFHVGAAVRAEDGRIFTAANVENASYGLSLCAEANAIAAAAVAGVRTLTHVAVVGYPAAAPDGPTLATPCGRCRQMIAEFAGGDAIVLVQSRDGTQTLRAPFREILPHAFGPDRLAGG
ncbi:cytidine deaminase [Acuticoccus mangrovi]|uniref:cytidine deaminase n=1 Tax=Acuticoccus mangrovi TaxID=2796142 RepID=UPI002FC8CE96